MINRLFKGVKKHGFLGSTRLALQLLTTKAANIGENAAVRKAARHGANGFVVKSVLGSPMLLNLNDVGISRELLVKGIHEKESTRQIQKELRPGMTIVEVGANIGYYSIIEAKVIGKTGKIYAFEPSSENIQLLRANLALNSLNDMVTVIPKAVGAVSGNQKFYIMSKRNMSSFYRRKEDEVIKLVDTVDVPTVTLDEYFSGKVGFDYLRMDVEGYETEIIKGMRNMLTSGHGPQGMFIEVHSQLLNEAGGSCRDFVMELSLYGYEVSVARYRGRADVVAKSVRDLLAHEFCEIGYWEVFFVRK